MLDSKPYVSVEYEWANGQTPLMLWQVKDGICFLTGLSGKMAGSGEDLRLIVENGWWTLTGAAQQPLRVTARCTSWKNFQGLGTVAVPNPSGTESSATLTHPRSICVLAGVQGKMQGGGETVQLVAPPRSEAWRIVAATQTMKPLLGRAVCTTLGGTGGVTLLAHAVWRQGSAPQRLVPEADGFCYLAGLTGDFEGYGERVEVYRAEGSWWVSGSSMRSGVSASVYCAAYDQRATNVPRPALAVCVPESYTFCFLCSPNPTAKVATACTRDEALRLVMKEVWGTCPVTDGPCPASTPTCPPNSPWQASEFCCQKNKVTYGGVGCGEAAAKKDAQDKARSIDGISDCGGMPLGQCRPL